MNPINFFKRFHHSANGRHQQLSSTNIFNTTNQLPYQHFQLESNRAGSSIINNNNTIREENETIFDPTYGFAQFAAKNNVYFQSNSVNCQQQQQIFLSTPPSSPSMFQDILFPLRTSTDSKKSEKIFQNSTMNENNMVNQCEPSSLYYANNNRKRVKFNENILSNFSPTTTTTTKSKFDFSVENHAQQQQLSLRQRLTNFFSNLF